MHTQVEPGEVAALVGRWRDALGERHVLTDEESCELYSLDFSEQRRATAAVVVQPASTEEVVEVVKIAASTGFAICPRGGGMSYTLGHVPVRTDSVIVDMTRMNRIVEINTEDLYITVEAGVTWKQVHDALATGPIPCE